jgi:hydroxyacylglutathione hydrolase
MTIKPEPEYLDARTGLAFRRVVVGPLQTNCWLLRDVASSAAVVIDPGDEPDRVLATLEGLEPVAVVLTHTHWDHVLGLPTFARALGVPVLAHRDDAAVWPRELEYLASHGHWDAGTATAELLAAGQALRPLPSQELWNGVPDRLLADGDRLRFGAQCLRVIHTPGHTPGGLSLLVAGHLFTGDTLFPGGPGLTGWPLSDFPTIVQSIRARLFTLPDRTIVHPGHGPDTTVGAERPHLQAWIERGW